MRVILKFEYDHLEIFFFLHKILQTVDLTRFFQYGKLNEKFRHYRAALWEYLIHFVTQPFVNNKNNSENFIDFVLLAQE